MIVCNFSLYCKKGKTSEIKFDIIENNQPSTLAYKEARISLPSIAVLFVVNKYSRSSNHGYS